MFISLGYLSLQMIIPLLIPVLYSIRHYLLEEFDKNLRNINNVKRQSVFINTFITSISYSLNIILFFIEYKKSKSSKKTIQEKEFNNQLLIQRKKMEKKQKYLQLLFLILLSLFNFFNLLAYDIINMFKPSDYNKYFYYALSIPVFFIITAFLSKLLLNYHIYQHQKVSMIISPLFSISLFVIIRILNPEQKGNTLYSILFLIEILGMRSLRYILDVLGKLLMDKLFVTHIKLMAFFGFFGIFFSLIMNSFSFLINMNIIENPDLNDYFIIQNNKKRFKNIFDKWGNFGTENWLLLIGNILLFFGENYIKWFCIYTFSPNHYTVYASINSIIILFIELVVKNLKHLLIAIFSIVGLCGVLICGLIFNEIIILRICNMDKYTSIEINKRQKEETNISMVKLNSNSSITNNNNDIRTSSFGSDETGHDKERNSNDSIKSD